MTKYGLLCVCVAFTVTLASYEALVNADVSKPNNANLYFQKHGYFTREKRAVATSFHAYLRNIQKVQTCCQVPNLLVTSGLQTCSRSKKTTIITSNGIFGAWQSLAAQENRNEKKIEDIGVHACYTDCVFIDKNLIVNATTATPVLEVANITSLFTASAGTQWNATITNAINTCQTTVSALANTNVVSTTTGKVCSTLPLRFMVCVRRNLILNCPTSSKTTFCRNSLGYLRNSGNFNFGK